MNFIRALSFVLILMTSFGCTHSVGKRLEAADRIAALSSLKQQTVKTDTFSLSSYIRISSQNKPIHIYIEGDGYAWAGRSRPSLDPTPKTPTTLILAAEDPSENVIYLARPCQYVREASCDQKYWTSHRFAPEIIDAMNEAIDFLKAQYSFTEIHLIGFSGGANIAALITAQRDDVLSLRTVAGNLDHVALHQHHNVSQTPYSLNAVDVAPQIAHIPQHHFIGTKDTIVPARVLESFINASGTAKCVQTTSLSNAAHQKGWLEVWPALLDIPIACRDN